MPRNAKPQQAASPTGQDYGDRQQAIAAQNEMPLPDMKGGGAPAGGAPPPVAGPNPMEAAMAMAPPDAPPWAAGPMDEQITAGLPSGPGAGPEALRAMKPRRVGLSDMLRNVAAATGNQHYAELAMEAAALEEET